MRFIQRLRANDVATVERNCSVVRWKYRRPRRTSHIGPDNTRRPVIGRIDAKQCPPRRAPFVVAARSEANTKPTESSSRARWQIPQRAKRVVMRKNNFFCELIDAPRCYAFATKQRAQEIGFNRVGSVAGRVENKRLV